LRKVPRLANISKNLGKSELPRVDRLATFRKREPKPTGVS